MVMTNLLDSLLLTLANMDELIINFEQCLRLGNSTIEKKSRGGNVYLWPIRRISEPPRLEE